MGIDFGSLISNLGQSAAKLQNNRNKIDTKAELNTYVSGFDAIAAKAKAENEIVKNPEEVIDIKDLETQMKSELASLMGAEFGKSAGLEGKEENGKVVFSEEEISLENMMALLEPEDNIDIDKLREYNKVPMASEADEQAAVDKLTMAGFSPELIDILVDETPGAINFITDAIKSGNAERIKKSAEHFGIAQNASDVETLGIIDFFGDEIFG